MDLTREQDGISARILAMCQRVAAAELADLYLYNIPVTELNGGASVQVDGHAMSMFASYSYLGLLGHPRINRAAIRALETFGTGTHGVRTLAGTLSLHKDLEETIARFKGTDDAITFSSGYVTNVSTISTFVGRHDVVLSDRLNHASIVDGCLLSGANFLRFKHNDMQDLARRLAEAPSGASKLVVTDAVFSMDGDIVDLPRLSETCHQYGAWLMVDEAHSLGVLGKTGRGIEEHFGTPGVIDLKMGTLSKTIPSVGGYIAASREVVTFLRHQARGYVFSAALPPAQAAAALEAFKVIEDEPWRVQTLRKNAEFFIHGLRQRGFNTLKSETAIVPILCGSDDYAFRVARESHRENIFVLPVVSPAVPEGLARLRATVTAAHSTEQIESAMDVFARAGHKVGLLNSHHA
jgi:8-amino-7-oxononanoate synthase